MAVNKRKHTERSEQKETLEEIVEAEERFRIMADGTPLIMWLTGPDGRMQFVNHAYREFFGVTLEHVQESGWRPMVHPDDAETYVHKYLTSLREQKPFHAETRVRRADGEWRWVDSYGAPIFSHSGKFMGIAGSSPDITKRKEMEVRIRHLLKERSEQLRQSQTNFQLLIHTMAEGVIVVDSSGHIKFSNPAAATIFNLPEKELIGYYFGVPAAVGVTEVETPIGKQRKILELNAVKIVWVDEPGYLVTLRDITQRKRAADWIRTLSRRLVEAQERERRDIGHELHDEVGGALTAIKLALGRTQKKLGKKSESELKKVDDLLDETMDMVSTLSHDMRPDILNEFGLVEALKWHFERYTSQTRVKVRFKQSLPDKRYPEIIETTAYRIIQESLTNVARYAGVNQAIVSIRSDSEKLYIQVEDRGCGFDAQQIETESSGICGMQDRAFLAGGELAVDSSPGKGTRITCELPLNST